MEFRLSNGETTCHREQCARNRSVPATTQSYLHSGSDKHATLSTWPTPTAAEPSVNRDGRESRVGLSWQRRVRVLQRNTHWHADFRRNLLLGNEHPQVTTHCCCMALPVSKRDAVVTPSLVLWPHATNQHVCDETSGARSARCFTCMLTWSPNPIFVHVTDGLVTVSQTPLHT